MKKIKILLIVLFAFLTSFGQDTIVNPITFENSNHEKYIRENIVGLWKDQNSSLYFYPNGNFTMSMDDKKGSFSGNYEIKNDLLNLNSIRPYFTQEYKIYYFSPTKMIFQITDINYDRTVWVARKVKQLKE